MTLQQKDQTSAIKDRYLVVSVDAIPSNGGVANFCHYFSNELALQHGETFFFGPKGTASDGTWNVKYKIIEDTRSDVSNRYGPRYKREVSRLERLFKRIISRYEITKVFLLHAFYYGRPLINICLQEEVPLALMVHGTEMTSQFPLTYHSDEIAETTENSIAFEVRYVLANANIILTNSVFTASVAKNIQKNIKTIAVGCGVSSATLKEGIERQVINLKKRQQYRLRRGDTNRYNIVFIGRLVPHKNVSALIEAISNVSNWSLTVVGDGPEFSNLQRLSVDLRVSDRVHFMGAVNDALKWDLLRNADFLSLPSVFHEKNGGYEGFGIVVLEAIVNGVLPIVSGHDGTKDLLSIYEVAIQGLGTGEDCIDLFRQLEALASNQQKYEKILRQAQEIVSNNLTWAQVVERALEGF